MKNNDKFNLKYFKFVVTENREGISVPVMNIEGKTIHWYRFYYRFSGINVGSRYRCPFLALISVFGTEFGSVLVTDVGPRLSVQFGM